VTQYVSINADWYKAYYFFEPIGFCSQKRPLSLSDRSMIQFFALALGSDLIDDKVPWRPDPVRSSHSAGAAMN
jgi:hypothetical protein